MAQPKRTTRRRAAVVVEVALVMPLLLLLTLALLEYGWAVIKIQQINSAAREAARIGARASATDAQVSAAVSAIMSNANIGTYSLSTTPSSIMGVSRGSTISARVEVNYSNIQLVALSSTPLLPFPMPTTLNSEFHMMKE
ncbi:MAG TPA: TadE/TadG family type IV pilus assembly protein [Phycisphaerae bacterium]|nr:TadE/TadG family type IV pilus assembly protein [Phycisphaerae bacterium]